jgi:hypothetical protein
MRTFPGDLLWPAAHPDNKLSGPPKAASSRSQTPFGNGIVGATPLHAVPLPRRAKGRQWNCGGKGVPKWSLGTRKIPRRPGQASRDFRVAVDLRATVASFGANISRRPPVACGHPDNKLSGPPKAAALPFFLHLKENDFRSAACIFSAMSACPAALGCMPSSCKYCC